MPSPYSVPTALAGSVPGSVPHAVTCWCWSWVTWTRQQVKSHPQNGQLQPKHLAGQAFKMLRPLRACTVEKEMEAPVTEVLEKDTGSKLRSKDLHMANLRTPCNLSMCLGWEQSPAPMSFYPSHSSSFHPWMKYALYPQLRVLPLQWKSQ